jgi:hypothetical protein
MSPWMKNLLLINVFKYHKGKVMIFIWIFPFSDLSDFVTEQVATQTQGQIFVQFGSLDFGLLPTLSIEGEDVIIESASMPTLRVDQIQFWPSLASLISSARTPNEIPNFSLKARGLFKGDLFASISNGKPADDVPMKQVRIDGERLDLALLGPMASLPLKVHLNLQR